MVEGTSLVVRTRVVVLDVFEAFWLLVEAKTEDLKTGLTARGRLG